MTVNNTTHIKIKPDFESNDFWEPYSSDLMVEFQQALDEGLDIEKYKDVFTCVSMLAKGETKTNLSNVLYDVVLNAKKNPEYKYIEPSTLEEIKELRKFHSFKENGFDASSLKNKIHGAWMGRVCGCLLGKPLEGIRTNELIPLLKETGNYPMHRYVLSTDITEEM